MKSRRPSPALVISCIALVVACTGTAFAATIISSSSQIKTGVVNSDDIKDKTIQGRDIKDGTITQNKLKSAAKTTGSSLPVGGSGAAYHAQRHSGPEGQPANTVNKVLSLSVPPGAYVVSAKTVMSAILQPQSPLGGLIQTGLAIGGNCKLNAGGPSDASYSNVAVNQRQTPTTLSMQVTTTVGAQTELTLECAAAVPFRLSETSIIAQPVGSIALTDVPAGA